MFDKNQVDNLMKNAQNMQQNLQKVQTVIAKSEVEGLAGNGVVKIVMNCQHEVKKVLIDPSMMNDKNTLEKMFAFAVNDAAKKVEAFTASKMMDSLSTGILNGLAEMKLPI